jgi:3-dehydroquinate synthase
VSEALTIQSHRGPYTVEFGAAAFAGLDGRDVSKTHFIVDALVAKLYAEKLRFVLAAPSVLEIEATEHAKSLERFPAYIEHLTSKGVRRDHRLIAIGGGIIQDITAFISSMLLRGVDWEFHPTTLLAQADSCIGSKTSINVGSTKNIVGNFWPPRSVYVSTDVQKSLAEADVRSGVGEMLKIHGVAGPEAFDRIAADYPKIFSDDGVMQEYIGRSLGLKVPFIEKDEFDRAERLVLNYGHTFGHAIEAATDFAVPHGIGVTLGCDMANFVSSRLGRLSESRFREMHGVLSRNARGFTTLPVPIEPFRRAIGRDKKNRGDRVTIIVPDAAGRIEKIEVENDARFQGICDEYLTAVRGS